jgi:hypothetical protein
MAWEGPGRPTQVVIPKNLRKGMAPRQFLVDCRWAGAFIRLGLVRRVLRLVLAVVFFLAALGRVAKVAQ